jgi:hypothetical protein
MISAADVRRWLKERGCNGAAPAKDKVSEIDALMNTFQREFDVEYAGSLAGYHRGLYEIEGKRFLVKDSPALIELEQGSWPFFD